MIGHVTGEGDVVAVMLSQGKKINKIMSMSPGSPFDSMTDNHFQPNHNNKSCLAKQTNNIIIKHLKYDYQTNTHF